MATKRLVWSGGNGTGGSISGVPSAGDWTNAYTTLQAALTARLANEEIWIHGGATSRHFETYASNQTLSCATASYSDRVKLITVDKDASNAFIEAGGRLFEVTLENGVLTIDFASFWIGVWLFFDRIFQITDNFDIEFERCTFECLDADARIDQGDLKIGERVYKKCTFKSGAENFYILAQKFSEFIDCDFSDCNVSSAFFQPAGRPARLSVIGCNLAFKGGSNVLLKVLSTTPNLDASFVNCKLKSGITILDSAIAHDGFKVDIVASDSGTAYYRTELYRYQGDTKTDSSVYLTGGYEDETGDSTPVPLSFKMTAAGAQCNARSVFDGIPIQAYFGATGSKTITIEAIENFTTPLTKRQAGIRVRFFGAASSTAMDMKSTIVYTDDAANLDAGAGLASWQNEPAGSRSVKLSTTITVNRIGLYEIIPWLGAYESGKVFYYDGKPAIT